MDTRRRVLAIVAASSGNLVEWFDFYTWAFCALYFAPAFFPGTDQTAQLLNTAGIFAVGFVMRPVGSWLFGRLADRRGRRTALVWSILLMCAGSLLIAVLPGFDALGLAAPALLVFARLLQGLSVGGEYGTTATYMSEVALEGRRGFFSSFQYVTLVGGQLLAVLVVVLLEQVLDDAALRAWGWRIPFALGAVTALVSLLLRRTLEETVTPTHDGQAGSLVELVRAHPRALLIVLGYTAGGSLCFYTFTTSMQKFLVTSSGLPARTVSVVMTVCLVVFMLAQPVFGALSDRIGRRRNMVAFGVLATLTTAPLLFALQQVRSPVVAGLLVTAELLVVALYTSVAGIVKAELFPPRVRALGVGVSYAVANAAFGGSAEYVALRFKAAGHEAWFFFYVTLLAGVSLVASLALPKRPEHLADG